MAFPEPCTLSTFLGSRRGPPFRTNPCREPTSRVNALLDYMKWLRCGDRAFLDQLLQIVGDSVSKFDLIVLGVKFDPHC